MQYMAVPAFVPLLWNPNGEWTDGRANTDDRQQSLQRQQMRPWFPPSVSLAPYLPPNCPLSMDFNSVVSLIEDQRRDLDRYLHQRDYQLAEALHRQQHERLAFTLRMLESKISSILKQKDEELARIAARSLRLEAWLSRLEEDKEAWQRIAIENEAAAVSLSNTLDRVNEPCLSSTGATGEAAASSTAAPMEGTSRGAEAMTRTGGGRYACKVCGSRDACMLLLPCRHVCLCRLCKARVSSCPICDAGKRGAIEVFLV